MKRSQFINYWSTVIVILFFLLEGIWLNFGSNNSILWIVYAYTKDICTISVLILGSIYYGLNNTVNIISVLFFIAYKIGTLMALYYFACIADNVKEFYEISRDWKVVLFFSIIAIIVLLGITKLIPNVRPNKKRKS